MRITLIIEREKTVPAAPKVEPAGWVPEAVMPAVKPTLPTPTPRFGYV
jgi:hypothetical protein